MQFRKRIPELVLLGLLGIGVFSQRVHAQSSLGVTVEWRTNSEPDIAGYRVYFGPQTNVFTNRVTVGPTVNRVRIQPLVPGADYYLVLTAFNSQGIESLPTDPPLHYKATSTPPTNTAPRFLSAIPDQYMWEDPTVPSRVDFVIADAESAASALIVRARSSNPRLIPDEYVLVGGSGSQRSVMIVPQLDQWGAAEITLEVRDPQGASSTLMFNVFVDPINDEPVVSPIAEQRVDEDTGMKLPFYVFDVETPPDELWVIAVSSDQTLIPDQNIVSHGAGNSRVLVVTPRPEMSGSCIIDLFVIDSEGGYAWIWFPVTVKLINDPPTLDPIPSFSIDEGAGVVVSLSGISSGAANEAQALVVSAVSSAPEIVPAPVVDYVSPHNFGSLIIAPVPDTSGTAEITVTVTDEGTPSATTTRSFRVTVRQFNNPPVIFSLPDLAVLRLPMPLRINFSVIDPDTGADELIVTGSSSDSELLPNSNLVFSGTGTQRTLTINPYLGRTGLVTVTVAVSDGDSTVSSSFYVLITAASP